MVEFFLGKNGEGRELAPSLDGGEERMSILFRFLILPFRFLENEKNPCFCGAQKVIGYVGNRFAPE